MSKKVQEARGAVFSLADFLPYRLAVVTDHVSRVFASRFDERFDLTIAEWRVLAVVAEHETLSPTQVGRHTAMDKVKVSRAAQSLVAKGLLRQSLDPRDGRGRLLRLTRKGLSTHAGMVPLANSINETVFGELNRADAAALARILNKISIHLETNVDNGSEAGE